MKHGDATVELGLHSGVAGGRKGHLTELLVLLADCAACERRSDQAGGKQGSSRFRVHRKFPPLFAGAMFPEIARSAAYGFVPLAPYFDCAWVSSEPMRIKRIGSRHAINLMF